MSDTVTHLLEQLRAGDESAGAQLFPLVYEELRALAGHVLRAGRRHTLQPTALVHEAYLRMAGKEAGWNDRRHFFNVAARAMRQILIDYARRQQSRKRGALRERLTVQGDPADDGGGDELDLAELASALRRLEELDPRQARVVELRFLVGLGIDEVAALLDVSPRTVNVDWQMARAWLRRALREADDAGSP